MNKIEVIHPRLIRPVAKLLVPKNKSQFRLVDDPDSESWNDYQMKREKVSFYDDKLVYRDTGVIFTLKGDNLSRISGYDFIKTDSPDAKHFDSFLDGMNFNIRATGESNRDRNLVKNSYFKKGILASGLRTVFLSEKLDGLCDRIEMLLQGKRAGNNSNVIEEEIVVGIDKFLEYNSFTPSEQKKTLKKVNLLHTKKEVKQVNVYTSVYFFSTFFLA